MNQQYSIAGLHLPHINQQDKLSRILSSALEKTEVNLNKISEPLFAYWNAQYFNLDNVTIFQNSTPAEKSSILQLCNLGILEEAYFIEKAGVGYMAKMILLAETTEERMLYALFAADEVTHLSQISRFFATPKINNNPFLSLLEEVVENDDKTILLFVLQVVLEGWGLTHYRSIAQSCKNLQLSSVIRGFLQDESRHHATGVTLFEKISSSKLSPDIIDILAMFLQMVQLGPQSVVTAIEQVKGDLSKVEKINIFEQLDTENHSGSRLKILRSLMHYPNATNIVENLQIQGCFQPLKASQCVLMN
ncbi:MAG: ferritin-like domain-containing protein [Richelia sp. SL_2_1]|nr:ferritin-like domain-containing protein [Richelia sp. SL_2_1]